MAPCFGTALGIKSFPCLFKKQLRVFRTRVIGQHTLANHESENGTRFDREAELEARMAQLIRSQAQTLDRLIEHTETKGKMETPEKLSFKRL